MANITIPKELIDREILPQVEKEMDREEILLVTGSRQCGKTYLLYILLKWLQERKIPSSQIFFFDLESIAEVDILEGFKNFDDFVAYLKTRGADFSQKVYVFIDEIQYLSRPSSFLKYLHDHYKPQLKFIVSGSSSLEIKRKFTDRLTGRVARFNLHPLSFSEYLSFRGKTNLAQQKNKINLLEILAAGITPAASDIFRFLKDEYLNSFEDFVAWGGYPKAVLTEEQEVKIKILSEIYSFYVRKDIKDLAGIQDVSSYNNLVKLLAFQIGSLVNESELSNSAALSRPTLRKYLFLLENTFVLYRLLPFFTNRRQEIVKMPKVYFEDTGLRNATVADFRPLPQRQDRGHLVENAVFCQLLKNLPLLWEIHFWRTERKAEVDFVLLGLQKEPLPIEVKYTSFTRPQISTGLTSFINKYRPKKAVVITRDFLAEESLRNVKVFFLPAWMV